MSDEIKTEALPQAEEEKTSDLSETTPSTQEDILIPVKFNKQVRNLNAEEAAVLAQKGLKYEAIEKDYRTLKELAAKDSLSVPEFLKSLCADRSQSRLNTLLEKCGGDRELAEHILKLEENTARDSGFDELKEYFPKIKSTLELPEQVLENAQVKGTLLLDEYLRYLLFEHRQKAAAKGMNETTEKMSAGSLLNRKGLISPETEEFLKGLWK